MIERPKISKHAYNRDDWFFRRDSGLPRGTFDERSSLTDWIIVAFAIAVLIAIIAGYLS